MREEMNNLKWMLGEFREEVATTKRIAQLETG